MVSINSNHPGAKVYLDDQYIGTTPVKTDVNVGFISAAHKVVLEKEGQQFSTEIKNSTISTINVVIWALLFAPTLLFTWQPEDSYTFVLDDLKKEAAAVIAQDDIKPKGRLIYDFNNTDELNDWKKVKGEWEISNGALCITGYQPHIELNETRSDIVGYSGTIRIQEAGEDLARVFIWLNSDYALLLDFKNGTAFISDKTNRTSSKIDGLAGGKNCSFSIKKEGGDIKFSVNDKMIGRLETGRPAINNLIIRGATSIQSKMALRIDKIIVETYKQ